MCRRRLAHRLGMRFEAMMFSVAVPTRPAAGDAITTGAARVAIIAAIRAAQAAHSRSDAQAATRRPSRTPVMLSTAPPASGGSGQYMSTSGVHGAERFFDG